MFKKHKKESLSIKKKAWKIKFKKESIKKKASKA